MRLTPLLTAAALVLIGLALPAAAAECRGRNLFDDMLAARLAQLQAATRDIPFHQGLFWQATKDGQSVTLIGTYHFDDPRHAATMAQFGPRIDAAATLMVEAGPQEEARLAQAMADDPALIVDAKGPTLPERMSPGEWTALWQAMEARGLPAVVTSRLRPWYVSMVLGLSPCMMNAVKANGDTGGLDHQLVERAQAAGVPVRALEPWNTVFTLFQGMTPQQEIDMIRAAMPAAEYADDYTVTLTDAYFGGDSWLIWEFGRFDAYDKSGLTRAQVDEQMRLAQDKLMDRRNQAWIAPIEAAARAAARDGKGIVVGFGALHLPGRQGVLSLMQDRGWTITGIEPQGDTHGR